MIFHTRKLNSVWFWQLHEFPCLSLDADKAGELRHEHCTKRNDWGYSTEHRHNQFISRCVACSGCRCRVPRSRNHAGKFTFFNIFNQALAFLHLISYCFDVIEFCAGKALRYVRILNLAQESIKCMRHSRRTTLTTEDVDSALGLRNVEVLFLASIDDIGPLYIYLFWCNFALILPWLGEVY